MKPLSRKGETLPRSGIREMMALAESTSDVIRLEAGEPSFRTPEHIISAAFEDARNGYTKYTHSAGIGSLRDAIADRHTARLQRPVVREEVFDATGAVGALAASVDEDRPATGAVPARFALARGRGPDGRMDRRVWGRVAGAQHGLVAR